MKHVIKILLIEDDELDQMEVERTLQRRNIVYRRDIVRNGEEGIRYLEDAEKNLRQRPEIILLDLNMPKMNGFEFLQQVRSHSDWRDIKIFILTTSDELADKKEALKHNVSGFITKPLKLESPPSLDAFNLMIDLMNI
jgi:CheY-like chemotaxis protein